MEKTPFLLEVYIMEYRIALLTLSVIFPFFSAGAEVIELAYEKADENPGYIISAPLIADGGETWQGAEKELTEGALTIQPTLHLPSGDEGVEMLMSIDTTAQGAKLPDTVYLDLDGDRIIGHGERFVLRPAELPREMRSPSFTMLCAEKVPLLFPGSDEPRHMNVYVMIVTDSAIEELKHLPVGLSGWGCYRGEYTIEGKDYEVTLEDRNGNGVFGDFAGNDQWDADFLLIRQKGVEGEPSKPLKERIVTGGNAYSVKVEENGRKLHLDLLDVEFGKVAAGHADMSFSLENSEWGQQYLMPGDAKEVPAGRWTISYFNLIGDDGSTFCVFSAKSAKTVDVTAGEKVVVDFETKVRAKVEARKAKDGYTLNLDLATAEGSKFRGYYAQDKRFDGVPFRIVDEKGTEVEKGLFKFG